MNERVWRTLVLVAAIGGGVVVWALTGFNPYYAPLIAICFVGAAAVALLIPERPAAAVGVVFLLAIFERFEIETLVGAMRMEQPAIGALLVATIWHRHRLALASPRPVLVLALCAAAYLASLAASSLLVAEVPSLSLRVVAWSALSMTGGLLAALLLVGRVREVFPWLVAAAAVASIFGLVGAVSYTLFGNWSMAIGGNEPAPRVFLPAYEPNLYASLLALLAPICVERYRAEPTRRNLALLALPLLAVSLGITRAAYIALAAGFVVYLVLHLRRAGFDRSLRRAAAATAVATLVGMALPMVFLNESYSGLLKPAVQAVADPDIPEPEPQEPATPRPEPEDLETFEYRLARVRIGLHEWQASPIIGRGAYSYGQRHIDNTGLPEVIAVLPVTVLHDAGIVGLVALVLFLAVLGWRLWRASVETLRGPPAIAIAASVTVMLVTYLSTTALHFAATWLILGIAAAASWPAQDTAATDSVGD